MTTMFPPSDGPARPVTDADLHAWVDGLLDPARVSEVMAWLQQHPDDVQRVTDWQTQRQALRRLARSMDPGEPPTALAHSVLHLMAGQRHLRPRFAPWTQALAASLLLALGVGVGHWSAGRDGGGDAGAARWAQSDSGRVDRARSTAPLPDYVRDAGVAHAVYTPEKRHPVEVTAEEQVHLVQWLSRRLGAHLTVPDLTAQGYRLLGGRLLPGEGSPRAQFMYEHADGARLTLYVTAFAPAPSGASAGPQTGEAAFRTTEAEGRVSFYWMDERFGYALNAPSGAPEVQAVARQVYRQLEQAAPPA